MVGHSEGWPKEPFDATGAVLQLALDGAHWGDLRLTALIMVRLTDLEGAALSRNDCPPAVPYGAGLIACKSPTAAATACAC